MAWGSNRAGIVQEAVEGRMTDQVSESFLQTHPNATFLVDRAAASNLTRFRYPWLVGPVEWDAAMKKRAVVWLAGKLEKPILKLVDEDYNESGAGGLLASTSEAAYEVNIDIFNRVQRTITGWPGGKPGADDTNRPERSQPFPKRILVLSPEPADAYIGMGGTIERLKEQGHEVKLVFQTSGSLRVADVAALNFARVEKSPGCQPCFCRFLFPAKSTGAYSKLMSPALVTLDLPPQSTWTRATSTCWMIQLVWKS
jgi:glucosamine-6-phosphate deaminase